MGGHLMKRSSSTNARGKKCDLGKHRKPQRGLGVAQLEKLRLQSLINSGCLSQGLVHTKVGFGDMRRTDIRHGKIQHDTFRIIPMEGNFHQPLMPTVTLPLLSQWKFTGSSNSCKYLDSSNAHEIDLELKLSC